MECVRCLWYCYLVAATVFGVQSIKNYPTDKNLISEEDRRGGEKLKAAEPAQASEIKSSETKKRGLFLGGIHRSPSSPIYPGLGIGYEAKEPSGFGYEGHHGLGAYRPPFGSSPPRERPLLDQYPGEYGGRFGGLYGHTGGGGIDYPVAAYGPGPEIGHQGGGQKNPLALKGLLLPLAGIALLGAAAALTANPVLLQLGVINGRRRRRGLVPVSNDVYPVNHIAEPGKK